MVGIMAEEREILPNGEQNSLNINGNDEENEEESIDGEEELDDAAFEDPEDFVDNISDEELLGDILKEAPTESGSLDSIIVVDNVPVVGPERLEKLKNVIRKVFSKFGKIITEFYPEENGQTKGYIFLEFSNPQDAMQAVKTANGYKLDKNHVFAVNAFSDFDRFSNVSKDWMPPEKQPYDDQGNLKSWLLDKDCNDQFSVIYRQGEMVSIFSNKRMGPEMIKQRPNWTDTYVRWSPNGIYLATFHQKGIAVWGGDDFRRLQRFSHPGVQLIDFSPCERYLVTYSPMPDNPDDPQWILSRIHYVDYRLDKVTNFCARRVMRLQRLPNLRDTLLNLFALQTQNTRHENKGRLNSRYQQMLILTGLHVMSRLPDEFPCSGGRVINKSSAKHVEANWKKAIIIWDIRTGAKRRGFLAGDASQWPVFKWNKDGKYFARISGNNVSVYETPGFGLLDKKSIKIPNIRDFSWSPRDNLIAYWVPEDKETPARVAIMELSTRSEVRTKNLFNVAECKIYWQKSGDFLCVKVERYTKSKKATFFNLELFKTKGKEIPVDTLEIKESILAFEWEPTGNKFCVIHGESPRICASFYQLDQKVVLLKKLEKTMTNSIFWSPTGKFCLLAGLRNMNGVFEFYDTGDMTCMSTGEHFMATDVEWDPTGRYVTTSVSWWAHKVDNGFYIWSFQGRLLHNIPMEQFCQFLWRPRPKTLLLEEDINEIKRNFKKYQKMFEAEDHMKDTEASKELMELRRRLFDDFRRIRERCKSRFEEDREFRLELRDGADTDELHLEEDIEEETIEFFVKEEIEVLDTEE